MLDGVYLGIETNYRVLQRQRCQRRQSNTNRQWYIHPGEFERVDRP